MNYEVAVVAAIPVYNVESEDESVHIAISKVGDMLNPDMSYVEIDPYEMEEYETSAFVVAGEALVALKLEMTVFNAEEPEHAERITRKEIGQNLPDIPLEVVKTEEVGDEEVEEESNTKE